MNWYVYKKDEPDTWPEFNCPILLYTNSNGYMDFMAIVSWDNKYKTFNNSVDNEEVNVDECFYAYIGCVPKGYKTHVVAKCINDKNCPYGCEDDGYCMYDNLLGSDTCGSKRIVNEYEVDMKLVCKEFE